MTPTAAKPRILCVDDQPVVLKILTKFLAPHYELFTAESGAEGLRLLAAEGPFHAVVSDMEMPEMDGVAFLKAVREGYPDAMRLLLTGAADLEHAIASVNEGQIFRFLTKPCPPEVLHKALQDAVEQHRLISAERDLLEQTLTGSIKLLTQVLSLSNPVAFGRATRAKRTLSTFLAKKGYAKRWPLELAAMFAPIGCITLPPATAERYCLGQPLAEDEQAMVQRLPELTDRLLANIPRLEAVRDILRQHHLDPAPEGGPSWEACLLRIVLDYDALEAQELPPAQIAATLKSRAGRYDLALLDEFLAFTGHAQLQAGEATMPLADIKEGMIFAQDLETIEGLAISVKGQEATVSLLARVRNFARSAGIREPIRMIVPGAAAAALGRGANL